MVSVYNIPLHKKNENWAAFINNVFFDIVNRHKEQETLKFDAFLLGILAGIKYKVDNKYHGFIIITGAVGAGKSTLAQGIGGVYAQMNDATYTVHNVVWRTKRFIEKTEQEDNFGEVIHWDESIQGATSRSMGITAQGEQLKQALVTKRFKKHLYILLIDEIEEYSWKLIKMAQVWIDVKAYGSQRGYFDAYTHKRKIKNIYLELKTKKKFPKVTPDHQGKFIDFTDKWIDPVLYDKMKLKETSEEKEEKKDSVTTAEHEKVIGILKTIYSALKSFNIPDKAIPIPPATLSRIKKRYSLS